MVQLAAVLLKDAKKKVTERHLFMLAGKGVMLTAPAASIWRYLGVSTAPQTTPAAPLGKGEEEEEEEEEVEEEKEEEEEPR